jgi:hypothetical protein
LSCEVGFGVRSRSGQVLGCMYRVRKIWEKGIAGSEEAGPFLVVVFGAQPTGHSSGRVDGERKRTSEDRRRQKVRR